MCSRVAAPASAVHPALVPLLGLVGKWTGVGKGFYPTIEPFEYKEECTFEVQPKKPLLSYSQRTFHPASGALMHVESGWVRAIGKDSSSRVELVVADATGVSSILEGDMKEGDNTLSLVSSSVETSGTAKKVDSVECRFELRMEDGVALMRRTLSMAAVGQTLQPHLECELRRSTKLPAVQLQAADVIAKLKDSDTVLLDVREPRETSSAPIANAVEVPMGEACATWTSAGSPAHEAIFGHKNVIVTCRSGRRSQAAIDYFLSSDASENAPFRFFNAVGGSTAILKALNEASN